MARQFDADKLSRMSASLVVISMVMSALTGAAGLSLLAFILFGDIYTGDGFDLLFCVIIVGFGIGLIVLRARRDSATNAVAGHIFQVISSQGLLRLAMLDDVEERLPLDTRFLGISFSGGSATGRVTFQRKMELLARNYVKCARGAGQEPLPTEISIELTLVKWLQYILLGLTIALALWDSVSTLVWSPMIQSAAFCLWLAVLNYEHLLQEVIMEVAARSIITALGSYD